MTDRIVRSTGGKTTGEIHSTGKNSPRARIFDVPKEIVTAKDLLITRRSLPHWQMGNTSYFVTFRTNQIDLTDEWKDIVVSCIAFGHQRKYGLSIGVVMSDHAHLLFYPMEKAEGVYFSLGEIMKPLKGVSARNINKMRGGGQSIWQEEWFDRIIRDEDEWREKYRYIQNNPVKRGLADTPETYRWIIAGENYLNSY